VYTELSIKNEYLIMPKQRRFVQCDVFSDHPTKGNALAVVLDSGGLSEEAMRSFAAWTNLAETTFLFPPDDPSADYRVRILTPTREMPFAQGTVRQECGVGIVEIDISSTIPAFTAPPTTISAMPAQTFSALTTKLCIPPDQVVRYAVLNNGPEWHVFELQTADQVLAVDSSTVGWPNEESIGLIGPHEPESECDFEVRMLAPSSGMSEDPITGSLNSALAHWRLHNNELDKKILVRQGTKINRQGRVHITPSSEVPGQASIGGHTNILIDGTVLL